jgi:putative FmdB family regulatory protein
VPVYEYGCQKCGETFEYQQRIADPPKTLCEACGGALERLISATSFHLKGSGWYKDLYSSPKKDAAGAGSGGDGASSGGASDAAAASTSEAKSSGSESSSSAAGSTSSSATKTKD